MYPRKFEHVSVRTVEEALDALETYDDAELLAGGQSLVPLQKTRFASPDYLIDITDIEELRYVEEDENEVRIGALAKHTDIQQANPIQDHVRLFSECIGEIADWPVRNQGTFGGTLAEADPSGDYLPVMKVLNPTIELTGPEGNREVPFEEFYFGMFTVDMDDEEILTGARLPKLQSLVPDAVAVGSAYEKHAERSGDYALVGVAIVVGVDTDGLVTEARVSVGAVGPLVRVTDAESVVKGTTLDEDALNAAATAVEKTVQPDEEGSEGEYKEAMAGEFAKRALSSAYDRATEEL
ncbi:MULTISPECIES: FAD binding domain-containing protein [Halobaculum]|uniref:Xanthine dehydrogenase family protein subunit M n=2 Tax=Halobaculum TaxID=43927 RepID=A0A8T8WH47_9EURY|nr:MULTISPECIES: xanthine dehydrogenase family protein subunit M [Halobaculum]QZP39165.1 xanthine dehydrogenase family protein subunit M [Halobaculum magnesiiphilum]QZY04199.1 xanthine dehydrogenase family protein subunit M [Halobaculum roseum]